MGDILKIEMLRDKINKLSREVLISEVWMQLRKDFTLAGMADFPVIEPCSAEQLVLVLTGFIKEAKCKTTNWDNINYRIDIPSGIDVNSLEADQYAQLIAYRTLLKVWTRKQFKQG
jgi:hypothetical protein